MLSKQTYKRAILVLTVLALTGCAQLAAPFLKPNVSTEVALVRDGQYKLDPTHASLLFKIDHLGYSNYVGRFERFDASLDFDPEDPPSARVEAVIDMTSLDIANDEFAAELMGPNWFDAQTYPQAVFKTYGLKVTGDNRAVISGDLTLKGETSAIEIDAVFNGGGQDRLRGAYIVGFSGQVKMDRTEFGVDRFSGLIADEVTIEIEAEFIRQSE